MPSGHLLGDATFIDLFWKSGTYKCPGESENFSIGVYGQVDLKLKS